MKNLDKDKEMLRTLGNKLRNNYRMNKLLLDKGIFIKRYYPTNFQNKNALKNHIKIYDELEVYLRVKLVDNIRDRIYFKLENNR
jgi:hypothetical protein